MIFAAGKLLEPSSLPDLLDTLENQLNQTLSGSPLEPEVVLRALETLGQALDAGEWNSLLAQFLSFHHPSDLQTALEMLRREALEARLALELGDLRPGRVLVRPFGQTLVQPLGVLFHVTPGNQAGIPLLSALEGLLTGNINFIKLPHGDHGLSLAVLPLLTQCEPRLAPYLYAFELSSQDTQTLTRLAALADGMVVWGGDDAVSALRRMAPPGVRLIEWGHRLSFVYTAGYEDREAELAALARHIIHTEGLLCSSCQVIYLDTDSLEEGAAFCAEFFPYLEAAAEARGRDRAAQAALHTQTYRLERLTAETPDRTWFGAGCSLTLKADPELTLSPLRGNVLVKCLPRRNLLPVLRRQKGHLQTAGLLCRREERAQLTALLAQAGVTRVTRAGELSHSFPGENHDGEYPLRRYVRLVDVEA